MATQKGKTLPASVQKRLQPFIDKGIQNGIFSDNQPVVALYRRKATELKDTYRIGWHEECKRTAIRRQLRYD